MITLFKDPFFQAVDRLFENETNFTYPKTKIDKTETEYKILISVPGLKKDDLKITVKDSTLKIAFEKEGGSTFVGNFTKTYTLPDEINENEIEGKVENGVLILILPIDKKKSIERLISLN
jgi:HSP20 family protein